MEEITIKFTHFLDCVWDAESEADQFKMKLLLKQGAKVKLFTQIDTQCNGQITAHDIQTFCQSLVRGNSWTTQIIGRYFMNWQEGINFNQFFDVMKPMNTQLYQEQFIQQTETTLFIKLVENIVVNFNNLQFLRKQLSMNSAKIIKYFSQNYGSGETITKEHLKLYMIDNCANASQKLELVLKYMFGNYQKQIPWQIFFNIKTDDTKCEIKPITMTNKQKLKIQENSDKQPSYQNMSKLCDKQNQNLEQVLSQIQQIEQKIKAKKLNLKYENIQISNQQKQNYQQSFIGKIVPSKKYFQQKNIGFRTKEQNYHESYTKRRDMIESPKIGIRNLQKCESQAQLKIKQIERRAMYKYLHKHAQLQSTNNLYYHPYYIQSVWSSPRQTKQKAYNRILYSQNRTTITADIDKINLRNKEKDYYWRPVSPRLFG